MAAVTTGRARSPRPIGSAMTATKTNVRLLLTVAALCSALFGSADAAGPCKSAPGRSGLDQYCEYVPGIAPRARSAPAAPGAGDSPSVPTRALRQAGADGR